LNIDELLVCPKCNNKHFCIKREATYIYTYKLDYPKADTLINKTEELPFLFDNREKIDSKEFLICEACGAKYPFDLEKDKHKIELTILRKAIRADNKDTPEFLD
jgi:uncharacterized protein YbaR (Trm112 family)